MKEDTGEQKIKKRPASSTLPETERIGYNQGSTRLTMLESTFWKRNPKGICLFKKPRFCWGNAVTRSDEESVKFRNETSE